MVNKLLYIPVSKTSSIICFIVTKLQKIVESKADTKNSGKQTSYMFPSVIFMKQAINLVNTSILSETIRNVASPCPFTLFILGESKNKMESDY